MDWIEHIILWVLGVTSISIFIAVVCLMGHVGEKQGYIEGIRDVKYGRELKYILEESQFTGETRWVLNPKYKRR